MSLDLGALRVFGWSKETKTIMYTQVCNAEKNILHLY